MKINYEKERTKMAQLKILYKTESWDWWNILPNALENGMIIFNNKICTSIVQPFCRILLPLLRHISQLPFKSFSILFGTWRFAAEALSLNISGTRQNYGKVRILFDFTNVCICLFLQGSYDKLYQFWSTIIPHQHSSHANILSKATLPLFKNNVVKFISVIRCMCLIKRV